MKRLSEHLAKDGRHFSGRLWHAAYPEISFARSWHTVEIAGIFQRALQVITSAGKLHFVTPAIFLKGIHCFTAFCDLLDDLEITTEREIAMKNLLLTQGSGSRNGLGNPLRAR